MFVPHGRGLRRVHHPRRPPARPAHRLPGGHPGSWTTRSSWPSPTTAPAARAAPTARSTRTSSSTGSRTAWKKTSSTLEVLGSPKTYNHYPNGWAMAFNTPYKMWKRWASLRGRHRRPLHHRLAHRHRRPWRAAPPVRPRHRRRAHPVRVPGDRPPGNGQGLNPAPDRGHQLPRQLRRGRGTLRTRTPSSTGCWAPAASGIGAGMPAPPTRRRPRAGGTSARTSGSCTTSTRTAPQLHNLAEQHPGQARRAQGPVVRGGRPVQRPAAGRPHGPRDPRRQHSLPASPGERYVYYPDCADVPEAVAVNVRNRPHTILAEVELGQGRVEGVLFGARRPVRRPQPVHQGRPSALRVQLAG